MNISSRKNTLTDICVSMALILICLSAGSAQAAVIDQLFEPSMTNNVFDGRINGNDWAQTFTVGNEGILTQVDLFISQRFRIDTQLPPNLFFDVRTTENGIPVEDDTNTLARLEVTYLSIPRYLDWITFDISSFGINVVPGDVLAIVLRADFSTNLVAYGWAGNEDSTQTLDPYGSGTSYRRNPTAGITSWLESSYTDLGFRTYVEPRSVPEPGTLLLLGSALVGLVAGRRIYKRQ